MTQPTRDEAREMLAEIEGVARTMRNALAAGPMAPNLIIWGLVWIVAFIGTYFRPDLAQAIWAIAVSAGGCASITVAVRHARQRIVLSTAQKTLGLKLLAFWLAIFANATLVILIAKPHSGPDYVSYFVLSAMTGYIIMGLWMDSLPLSLIGLFVGIMTVIGRFALSEPAFLIWMAVFGGGGLLLPGIYIRWRWRRP